MMDTRSLRSGSMGNQGFRVIPDHSSSGLVQTALEWPGHATVLLNFFDEVERRAVSLTFVKWIGVGEWFPLLRPPIQVVHGTVPQKWVRNTHPARSGILYRAALGELRCRQLPTSSTRAPEATSN